ncbi:MAG: hypothetical protein H0W84_12465 [Bacteroidetes bacterium]|nr:hypothetical protein [Bacteroidota bacterium]
MILNKYLSGKNERSAKAVRNIIGSFIIKGISIVVNLALIPLTINYLSPVKYGVWLTISSTLAWINFFDVGLGHGLRNKLASAIANNEMDKAKSYVSTAYISISILCIALFILFMIANWFINWNTLLNIPHEIDENLRSVAFIVFSMFAVQFILQLINSVLLSIQQPVRVSMNNVIANILVLFGIVLLINFTKGSLFHIAFLFSVIPVLVLIVVNIYYFNSQFKSFSPSIKSFDYASLKDVLNLGVKFFIIQVSVLMFYGTTNFLICRYLGSPELVTPYNIAFRYFGIVTMVFSIIIAPYWSACTEAYAKGDFIWINRSIKQLLRIWMLLVVLAVIMLIFSEDMYHLWVGDKVKVDFKISLFMMLYVVVVSFGNIFITFINGIGNIRTQMIVSIIGMILFIPLSYYLAVTLNLGIVGIIISTIICSLYGPILAPLEVKRILSKGSKKLMNLSHA